MCVPVAVRYPHCGHIPSVGQGMCPQAFSHAAFPQLPVENSAMSLQGKIEEATLFFRELFGVSEKMPYLCTRNLSPDGGIGRRVGLKHQYRKVCRFDPGSGYCKQESQPCKGLTLLSFCLFLMRLKSNVPEDVFLFS